jgi:hypothetical protein
MIAARTFGESVRRREKILDLEIDVFSDWEKAKNCDL